jgi:hypothetical protein
MLREKKKSKTPSPPASVAPSQAAASVAVPVSADAISETSSAIVSPSSTTIVTTDASAVVEGSESSPRTVSSPIVPTPPLSASVVSQHTRTQSQSEKSYLSYIKALITNTTVDEIDAMIEVASANTSEGYAEKCRFIKEALDYLDSKKNR